jgi:hypothetical protein
MSASAIDLKNASMRAELATVEGKLRQVTAERVDLQQLIDAITRTHQTYITDTNTCTVTTLPALKTDVLSLEANINAQKINSDRELNPFLEDRNECRTNLQSKTRKHTEFKQIIENVNTTRLDDQIARVKDSTANSKPIKSLLESRIETLDRDIRDRVDALKFQAAAHYNRRLDRLDRLGLGRRPLLLL